MGQYLNTSIITEFSTDKSNLKSFESDGIKQIQKLFLGTEEDVFDIEEDDSSIVYKVKKSILQEELIRFLEKFYPDLHGEERECEMILDDLKSEPDAAKWIEKAEGKSYERFQMDDYGFSGFYHRHNWVQVRYSCIMLALEGKISMEVYGTQFSFFERLIRRAYADFKISNLIKIGITG